MHTSCTLLILLVVHGLHCLRLQNPLRILDPQHSPYPLCVSKVLFAPLPVLWITGTLASASKGDKNIYYTCPTYKAPRRTGLNYITAVDLRTEDSASKWTLRGVALLTTTE